MGEGLNCNAREEKQHGQHLDSISSAMLLMNIYVSMYSYLLWYLTIFDIEYISIHRFFLIPKYHSNLNLTEMQESSASSWRVHGSPGQGGLLFLRAALHVPLQTLLLAQCHCPGAISAPFRRPLRCSLSDFMPLRTRTLPAFPRAQHHQAAAWSRR